MMATLPRPLFFYPPSVEFILRRCLNVGPSPTSPATCTACGRLVAAHRDPSGAFIPCEELARRSQERES